MVTCLTRCTTAEHRAAPIGLHMHNHEAAKSGESRTLSISPGLPFSLDYKPVSSSRMSAGEIGVGASDGGWRYLW
jgi:hypothetical protein